MLDLTHLDQGLDIQTITCTRLSALSPQTWPFSVEWLPESAYLVGGSVRDALLGRHSEYLDLDFVLPEKVVETARTIARHYKAGFVLLDEERQIARVVFPQGTVDFAQQVGPTLEADLLRRDFTVNAIAYNPQSDRLFDPLQGRLDLQQQQLRMVSIENLEEDPLRLLRAYRQAAQLGFSLEPETQAAIRQLAPLLRRIAAERVQSELNYLLSTEAGTPWLTQAWQDGLLQSWLPDATARSLELVEKVDWAALLLNETSPTFAQGLFQHLRPGLGTTLPAAAEQKASGSARNWLMTAKLACLQAADPDIAEMRLRKLKYSRVEIQAVCTVLKFLPVLETAAGLSGEHPPLLQPAHPQLALSLREQYFFFQGVGAVFPAVAVVAIAHGVPLDAIAPLIERFLTPEDPVAHPIPLLTGQDLMKNLHIPAGPVIGKLLAAIQLARAEGKIRTIEEALQLAKEIISGMC
ncbi:CCA tRNA nucleotidyltransferase [Leptodesmis sichuanensis]|uniref:CCA tRNA nucleotidyltransferase n=1 Tax=Leptodesmis sichuanensis TaxID=2906798 RepID=UPI001F2F28F7|nr:CCA tRNA nucleotidyltransferase [Leptodesmis sichuanensis]UIE36435.1 CCA tRNA nucleotidyltransferase [Leptodesmis sichuanensis A121]